MGTTLNGTTPQNTYPSLIKVGDNGALDATLQILSDGEGNDLPMEVSTTGVNFTGTLTQNGQPVTTPPSGGAGSIQFSDGSAFASDSNLFWDNTNKRLGIAEGTPTARVHIKGSGSTSATTSLLVQNSSSQTKFFVDDSSVASNTRVGITNLINGFSTLEWPVNQVGIGLTPGGGIGVKMGGTGTFTLGTSASIVNIPSAILAMNTTTKGFLPPRMTTTQKNAISSPASGLMVYDTDTNKLCCYNGTSWNDLF